MHTFHYVLRALLMGGFSYLIVKLVKDERLNYYIAPRTELLVKLSALAMFILAVVFVYIALHNVTHKQKPDCGCSHQPSKSKAKNIIIYSMFLLPLLLGLFTSDTLLGSNITSLKGGNLATSNNVTANSTASAAVTAESSAPPSTVSSSNAPAPAEVPTAAKDSLDTLFPFDEYTEMHATLGKKLYEQDTVYVQEAGFIETLTTLDLYKENFLGKEIVISGFVYREDDMTQNQFVVARLAMMCCSADTEPYGILATYSHGNHLAEDTWVRITGVLTTTAYREYEIMDLDVSKVEYIETPSTPYVYPNDGYADEYDSSITAY